MPTDTLPLRKRSFDEAYDEETAFERPHVKRARRFKNYSTFTFVDADNMAPFSVGQAPVQQRRRSSRSPVRARSPARAAVTLSPPQVVVKVAEDNVVMTDGKQEDMMETQHVCDDEVMIDGDDADYNSSICEDPMDVQAVTDDQIMMDAPDVCDEDMDTQSVCDDEYMMEAMTDYGDDMDVQDVTDDTFMAEAWPLFQDDKEEFDDIVMFELDPMDDELACLFEEWCL